LPYLDEAITQAVRAYPLLTANCALGSNTINATPLDLGNSFEVDDSIVFPNMIETRKTAEGNNRVELSYWFEKTISSGLTLMV
jgi:hypothetical protein